MWAIDRIKPYDKNPRTLPENAVQKVAASLKAFGFQKPIVVDEAGVVIAGHVVLKAAQQAGFSRVPVLISNLDAKAARAYRLADNRTAQETDWLEDLLKDELTALDDDGFDLAALGFDDRELQKLMSDDEEMARAEETQEPPVNPVSVLGDVWLLGKHRILCGDSTKADDVDKVLNGVKPHLMVTDPPYGVVYDPEKARASSKDSAKGKVLNDDRADWREAWDLFPGDVAYVWHADRRAREVVESLEASDLEMRCQIIWDKGRPILSRGHYHFQHEPCWYAVRTKGTGHWTGARDQSSIWKIEHRKSDTGHGTQKPVDCMRRPIMNNSSPGQAVYEPFSGSGTTIIAAEMTGRTCHAIELNPAYVDVAVMRWQTFTGQQAIHEETGKTYDEIKDSRCNQTRDCHDSCAAGVKAIREKLENAS